MSCISTDMILEVTSLLYLSQRNGFRTFENSSRDLIKMGDEMGIAPKTDECDGRVWLIDWWIGNTV